MRAFSIALCLCCAAAAQDLDGKKIAVAYGPAGALHPVIALPFAGTAEGRIVVSEPATAKDSPATLRGGELVFIPEGGLPNTEHTYAVSIQAPSEGTLPAVRVEKRADADVIDVLIFDEPFTAYYYAPDLIKPFLWPLNSEGGITVTRDYPMKTGGTPKFAQDHPHHRSMWTSYGDVNGNDFWLETDAAARQTSGEATFGSSDAYGWIAAKNVWKSKDGAPVIDETREYRFYAAPASARIVDVTVTFTASHGAAKFGDTKEGGIVSVRMRPELSYAKGVITNAHGDVGEKNLWGKPAAWCDYSGELPEAGWRGLAIFDHPSNLRHPTSWHVRNYGLMGANCFGYSHFVKQAYNQGLMPENGDFTLEAGQTQTFRYRVLVHTGDAAAAKVADRYAGYATPPQARWSE